MADDADRSDDRIQKAVDLGIEMSRRQLNESLPAIGICHWCESPVPPARIFCSKECADDHQHEKKRRRDLGL